MNQPLQLSQFDYVLPPELIAQTPSPERTGSRLLNLDADGALHDRQFTDLPQLLNANDLLVFNNTRVIKARLRGQKESGGKIEILVERITRPNTALVHIKASKSPKAGSTLIIAGTLALKVLGREGELFELEFPERVLDSLEHYGSTPLPPYIEHEARQEDEDRYQTVYACKPGAVAAPTAGLHFDQALLAQLAEQGIRQTFVTLHVGAGTFQPVRTQNLSEHIMHSEHYSVSEESLELVRSTHERGGRVVAVGTTSVRALEAAVGELHQTSSVEADTRLFITPGYKFSCIDALITNFHLPQSTLLMLVSALAGMEPIKRAYAHAVQARYRFFSYGDAMFIESPRQ